MYWYLLSAGAASLFDGCPEIRTWHHIPGKNLLLPATIFGKYPAILQAATDKKRAEESLLPAFFRILSDLIGFSRKGIFPEGLH